MRVPGRAHKRARDAYCVATAAVVADRRVRPLSRNSGNSCMTMMNTQRPMAVSMVAGRGRRTGAGLRARSSHMVDTSEKCLLKNHGHRPRILDPAAETI